MTGGFANQDEAVIVVLSGQIDVDASAKVLAALLQAVKQHRFVIVDLEGVSHIDSAGAAILVEALEVAHEQGKPLALIRVPDKIEAVLKLERLDTLFSIDPSTSSTPGVILRVPA